MSDQSAVILSAEQWADLRRRLETLEEMLQRQARRPTLDDLLTVSEVAERFRVGRNTVYADVSANRIRHRTRPGRGGKPQAYILYSDAVRAYGVMAA